MGIEENIEENKDLVRRFVSECVNAHREDLLDQFVAADVTMYPGTPDTAEATHGIDELLAAYRRFRILVPAIQVEHGPLVAAGPEVVGPRAAAGTPPTQHPRAP